MWEMKLQRLVGIGTFKAMDVCSGGILLEWGAKEAVWPGDKFCNFDSFEINHKYALQNYAEKVSTLMYWSYTYSVF